MDNQKILITTNHYFSSSDLAYFLSNELGGDYMEWLGKLQENDKSIRTDKQVQELILRNNLTIKNAIEDNDFNPIGYGEDTIKFKIIEIPSDVKWFVRDFECAIGEFICEEHRTWN